MLEEEELSGDSGRKKRQNILLEKRLLKFYNRVFLSELFVYVIAGSTVVFLGSSYLSNHLNIKVANFCFIIPGLVFSFSNLYLRSFHNYA